MVAKILTVSVLEYEIKEYRTDVKNYNWKELGFLLSLCKKEIELTSNEMVKQGSMQIGMIHWIH